MNTDDLIDEIIRREGGFVDDASDRGGATKFGITQATLESWRGRPVSRSDVEAMTRDEAELIYRTRYIRTPNFDKISDPMLRGLIVDAGVNHGVSRAAKWLQKAAGVTQDGKVGPQTLEAVNSGFPSQIYMRVLAERIRFYGRIISNDHTQAKFAAGWLNRATEFLT